VEQSRANPDSICVLRHPGTLATPLSASFPKSGLDVRASEEAARDVMAVFNGLQASGKRRLL